MFCMTWGLICGSLMGARKRARARGRGREKGMVCVRGVLGWHQKVTHTCFDSLN
jgi:hypothetical protein